MTSMVSKYVPILTLTTQWVDSADFKLIILLCPAKKSGEGMLYRPKFRVSGCPSVRAHEWAYVGYFFFTLFSSFRRLPVGTVNVLLGIFLT